MPSNDDKAISLEGRYEEIASKICNDMADALEKHVPENADINCVIFVMCEVMGAHLAELLLQLSDQETKPVLKLLPNLIDKSLKPTLIKYINNLTEKSNALH